MPETALPHGATATATARTCVLAISMGTSNVFSVGCASICMPRNFQHASIGARWQLHSHTSSSWQFPDLMSQVRWIPIFASDLMEVCHQQMNWYCIASNLTDQNIFVCTQSGIHGITMVDTSHCGCAPPMKRRWDLTWLPVEYTRFVGMHSGLLLPRLRLPPG